MPYKICEWDKHFEVAQTRKIDGPLKWIALPTKHDGTGYRRVLRMGGGEVYAAWVLLVQVTSKCPVRGVLADETGDLTPEDLADKTGYPAEHFERAFEILSSPKIQWLERVTGKWERSGSGVGDEWERDGRRVDENGPTVQDSTEQKDYAADAAEIPPQVKAEPDPPKKPTPKAARPHTVDGLVFDWMRQPRDRGGLGLSKSDAAKAGAMLKGRGGEWTPHKLGALLYAQRVKPPPRDTLQFARGCMTGKSGVLRDYEACVDEATKQLKALRLTCDRKNRAGNLTEDIPDDDAAA